MLSNTSLLHSLLSTLMFVIVLLKLPELASGLSGGVAANGFGNLMSVATSTKRMLGGKGGGKGKSNSSGGAVTPEAQGK